MINALSIDGGGARGILPAVWLEELERRVGKQLRRVFHLLAGTSTGAILVCALGAGLNPRAIADLYRDRGLVVFPRGGSFWWSRFRRSLTQGPSAPLYDGRGLEAELQRVFGDIRFGELRPRVMVTAYNALSRSAVVLRSWEDGHLPVWLVCRAAAAAPIYLPGVAMRTNGTPEPFLDGGVGANNPSVLALAEARRLELGPVRLVSLGTGSLTTPITLREVQEWGPIEWAKDARIVDVIFDAAADFADQCAEALADEYFRFQITLPHGYDSMSDAQPETLATIESWGRQAVRGELASRFVAAARALIVSQAQVESGQG